MRPKMQLSQDVCVSDSFRAEINAWMIDFFGYIDDEPEVAPIVYSDGYVKPTKPRASTQVKVKSETLKELLEGLNDSFDTMRMPKFDWSMMTNKEITAIKKLGIFVPTPFLLYETESPEIPKGTNLPVMASALFVTKKNELEKGKIYPRFSFLVKQPSLPSQVERVAGVPYKYGLCYEVKQDESGKSMPPRSFWAYCWVVIRPDRTIAILKENHVKYSVLRHKRRGGTEYIPNRQWRKPWLISSIDDACRPNYEHGYENFVACMFQQTLLWWVNREQQWSVGVRKDGHRATFGIDPKQTSSYFADRDVVVNQDGKPRKIIHFVREHTRVNGSTVKAHLRGLREFDWNGFHCVVTAPKMNGSLFSVCPLSPVDEVLPDVKYIEVERMAKLLADKEDGRRCVVKGMEY